MLRWHNFVSKINIFFSTPHLTRNLDNDAEAEKEFWPCWMKSTSFDLRICYGFFFTVPTLHFLANALILVNIRYNTTHVVYFQPVVVSMFFVVLEFRITIRSYLINAEDWSLSGRKNSNIMYMSFMVLRLVIMNTIVYWHKHIECINVCL